MREMSGEKKSVEDVKGEKVREMSGGWGKVRKMSGGKKSEGGVGHRSESSF